MKRENKKKNMRGNLFFFCSLLIIIYSLLMGCASPKPAASTGVNTGSSLQKKKSKGNELDNAIRELSDYLNSRVPAKNKVVFLNVRSDYPDLSEYIISNLTENAVNDDVFVVVDRQQLNDIRAELNFQWSGEVSDASAQKIGQMFGAQTIVSGNITTIGSIYRIQVRAISVQNAELQGQFTQNVDGKLPIVASLTKRVAPASGQRPQTGTQVATPTVPTATAPVASATAVAPSSTKTYAIGDNGPAGGLIFYDKGNNSGGWRYLEAGPIETEFSAQWSIRETRVENTQEIIGSGKRNTQLIVEKFKNSTGEWDTAAQKVNDLVYKGFDDWFLPSISELDQMYGNLKRRNLGNFKNGSYWSSSSYEWWNNYYACIVDFKDGTIVNSASNNNDVKKTHYVRPIRQVAGQ